MKKEYAIRDREAGNVIDVFGSLKEAEEELARYEAIDEKEGTYTPDFYEIVEKDSNKMERLSIRCTNEQKEAIKKAAALKGQTISEYLLMLATIENCEEEPKQMLKKIGVKNFNEIKEFRLCYARPMEKVYQAITDLGEIDFRIIDMLDGSRRSKLDFFENGYEFSRNVNLMVEY